MPRKSTGELVDVSWKGPRRTPVNMRIDLEDPARSRGFWLSVPEQVRLWVLPGGHYAIPERMTFEMHDARYPPVELDFVLEDGKLVCESIRRRRGEPPLTGRSLRLLKLDDFVEEALQIIAVELTERPDGSRRGKWVKDEAGSALDAFLEEAGRVQLRPKRGRQLTRKHYEAVAAVVLEARAKRRPLLQAIEDRFEASPTTAKRWKREAERLGLIPTTKERAR